MDDILKKNSIFPAKTGTVKAKPNKIGLKIDSKHTSF